MTKKNVGHPDKKGEKNDTSTTEITANIKRTFAKEWNEVAHLLSILREMGVPTYQITASEQNPIVVQLNVHGLHR